MKKSSPKKEMIVPVGDRVLIKPTSQEDRERKLPSGIILPETVSKEKSDRGKVVAIGEGRVSDEGKRIPMRVKVGQTVIFQWGDKFEIGGVQYFLVSESNILAVVK